MVVAWVRRAGVWGRGEVGGGVWEVENGGGRPGWCEGGGVTVSEGVAGREAAVAVAAGAATAAAVARATE